MVCVCVCVHSLRCYGARFAQWYSREITILAQEFAASKGQCGFTIEVSALVYACMRATSIFLIDLHHTCIHTRNPCPFVRHKKPTTKEETRLLCFQVTLMFPVCAFVALPCELFVEWGDVLRERFVRWAQTHATLSP